MYSLEASWQGASDKYLKHFILEKLEKMPIFFCCKNALSEAVMMMMMMIKFYVSSILVILNNAR